MLHIELQHYMHCFCQIYNAIYVLCHTSCQAVVILQVWTSSNRSPVVKPLGITWMCFIYFCLPMVYIYILILFISASSSPNTPSPLATFEHPFSLHNIGSEETLVAGEEDTNSCGVSTLYCNHNIIAIPWRI